MDRHVFGDEARQLIGEGIVEPHLLEFLDEQGAHGFAALHLLPHQAGDLVLQQLADAGHLLAHPLHLLIPLGGLGLARGGGRTGLGLGGLGSGAPLALFGQGSGSTGRARQSGGLGAGSAIGGPGGRGWLTVARSAARP